LISTLLKQVMEKFELRQKDLAEVMGASLSRIKAMTSGRVKNLTQEEIKNLADKLDIRTEWLISGEGPMLQDDEPQKAFAERMHNIAQTHAMIDAMPIDDTDKLRAKVLVSGDPAEDAKVIADLLTRRAVYFTGAESPALVLTAREAALLDNYRAAPEDGKQALETTGAALAKSTELKKAG